MLFLSLDVVKVHLTIVIELSTIRTGMLLFKISNVLFVAVACLTLVFRFPC